MRTAASGQRKRERSKVFCRRKRAAAMHETLEEEVRRIVANMENEQNEQHQETPEPTEQEQQSIDTIHIHYFPDAIVILKEDENTAQVVDSAPVIPQKISFLPAYATGM